MTIAPIGGEVGEAAMEELTGAPSDSRWRSLVIAATATVVAVAAIWAATDGPSPPELPASATNTSPTATSSSPDAGSAPASFSPAPAASTRPTAVPDGAVRCADVPDSSLPPDTAYETGFDEASGTVTVVYNSGTDPNETLVIAYARDASCARPSRVRDIVGHAIATSDEYQGPNHHVLGWAYRHVLYTHCGVREAQFAGSYWVTSLGGGSAPAGWSDPQQEGTMRLLDGDTAVFRASDGHQVRFTRRVHATGILRICR